MKRTFELEPGEQVVDEWVAGIPSRGGRTATYGGQLILTNKRLIWEALRLPGAVKVAAGMKYLDQMTHGVSLGEIRGVRPDEKRKAMLRIDTADGEMRFLVSASRMSPLWSEKNREARDAAVGRIAAAAGLEQGPL